MEIFGKDKKTIKF